MRTLLLLSGLFLALTLSAQVPATFDFQGVARDASGNVLSGQAIGLRLSLHSGTANGPVVYQESHAVTTGNFGVFNVQVGGGTPLQGTITGVAWGTAAHFLQVEMDANGGTNYVDMGTSQLLSVPYALHAGGVPCATVSLLGDTLRQGNGCFVIIPGISAANGGCLDVDGDGYYHIAGCGPVDCDDADPLVSPGAAEVCGNGKDDDCNGATDELTDTQLFLDWHPDADNDGYGNGSITISACAQPAGHVLDSTDCDDGNAAVFPGQGCSLFCTQAEVAWVDQNQAYYLDMADYALAACNGAPDLAACMTSELLAIQNIPLSAACHACVVERAVCIQQNCGPSCGPFSELCEQCKITNCNPGFLACMGLTDSDGDGWASGSDCDDSNSAVNPNAQEVCNGIDDNCDGLTDDEDPYMAGPYPFFQDNDGDGFGSPDVTIYRCSPDPVPGLVPDDGSLPDCNDNDPTIFPGAQEICDEWDNDCDGVNNEANAQGETQWYRDADGDGHGTDDDVVTACSPPSGYVGIGGDCDDLDSGIYPGALEDCFDGLDNDCDGVVDEVQNIWYQDLDGDGFGNEAVFETACTPSPGYVQAGGDCNDTDASIRPGVPEVCGNGVDDDCDGLVDENALILYLDADGDGFGDPEETVTTCTPLPGYVANDGDCDDNDGTRYPGATELCNGIDDSCDGLVDENCITPEVCDGVDNNGDGQVDEGFDMDGDGFTTCAGDCDDNNASISPVSTELCNGLDDDCDGTVDEGCGCIPGSVEACGSDVGNCQMGTRTCQADGTWGPCIGEVLPGPEVCDGIDNDCDGQVDDGFDMDGDGVTTCAGDCNDNDASVFPGAEELCNGIDDNCDGAVDEGCGVQ